MEVIMSEPGSASGSNFIYCLTPAHAVEKVTDASSSSSSKAVISHLYMATLDTSLLEKARLLASDPDRLKHTYQPRSYDPRIYMPSDLPIVLKQITDENETRFAKTQQARELCQNNGFSEIVVPDIARLDNFFVESRLPLPNRIEIIEQIGLYCENFEKFEETAKQFMHFICLCELDDIIGDNLNALVSFSQVDLARYDNVCLYLEEGKGKAGLVDLEFFDIQCKKDTSDWLVDRCKTAITFFPYQLDLIISEARQIDSTIDLSAYELKQHRQEVLTYYDKVYYQHAAFVKEKRISLTNPIVFPEISKERKEGIGREVIAVLLERFKDSHSIALIIPQIKEHFSDVFDALLATVDIAAKKNLRGRENLIASPFELPSLRTVIFTIDRLGFCLNEKMPSVRKIDLFPEVFIDLIFYELKKGGDICDYSRNSIASFTSQVILY